MNKKIKIIELLQKIANGEDLPKRIRYDRFIWILGKTASKNTDYQMEENSEQFLFSNYILTILVECLNEEVEILEDNTEEIEEIDNKESIGWIDFGKTIGEICRDISIGFNKALENEIRKEKE